MSILAVPTPHVLVDMRSPRATAFGITREINTTVPYELPQRWAAALADAGAAGIRYDPRFSTAPSAVAYALFGNAGQASWPVDPSPVRGASVAEAAGIAVARIPPASAVTVIPAPSRRPHKKV